MSVKVAISQFKAHCLEIIEKLQNDNQQIIITKRDKPVAKVTSLNTDIARTPLFGVLRNKAEIKGDIVISSDEKWDAERT